MTIAFNTNELPLEQKFTPEERAGMVKKQFVNEDGVLVTVYTPTEDTPAPKNYKWTKKRR